MLFINLIKELKWNFISKKIDLIKLLVLDVDGVMTDGKLYYDSDGNQIKSFSVKDGLGLRLLQNFGIEIAIISGGKSPVIEKRALDLNIKNIFTNIKNKKKCLMQLQKDLLVKTEETIYVGDDINDLSVRDIVALLISTKDGSNDFKKKCDAVLISKGGDNAVREICERILRKNQVFKKIRKEGFIEKN